MKLRSGDAIVSRKETIQPFLDMMHAHALNLKNTVGVGSSEPIGSAVYCLTKGPRPAENTWVGSSNLGSEVLAHPSEVPCSF